MAEANEKAYVLVRMDMGVGYKIVQTAHAAADHEKKFPGSMAGRTMVVLGVQTEFVLKLFSNYLREVNVPCTIFYEPDIEEYTAMAVSPSEHSIIFAGLPLAGS